MRRPFWRALGSASLFAFMSLAQPALAQDNIFKLGIVTFMSGPRSGVFWRAELVCRTAAGASIEPGRAGAGAL